VKRHSFYLKPGERRRVKQALAQKRARKTIRKERGSGCAKENGYWEVEAQADKLPNST